MSGREVMLSQGYCEAGSTGTGKVGSEVDCGVIVLVECEGCLASYCSSVRGEVAGRKTFCDHGFEETQVVEGAASRHIVL